MEPEAAVRLGREARRAADRGRKDIRAGVRRGTARDSRVQIQAAPVLMRMVREGLGPAGLLKGTARGPMGRRGMPRVLPEETGRADMHRQPTVRPLTDSRLMARQALMQEAGDQAGRERFRRR